MRREPAGERAVRSSSWGMLGPMTATHREIERKYEATDVQELPPWPQLFDDAGVRVEEQVLIAAYFDTPDLRLLKTKITLRHRSGDDEAGWHLKLPVGGDARDEIQVAAAITAGPPAEFLDLTRAARRGQDIAEVATLTTQRTLHRWYDEKGRHLLAVTDDRVNAEIPGAPDKQWREIEVELGVAGSPSLLDLVQEALAEVGVARSHAPSKLARAFAAESTPSAGSKVEKPKDKAGPPRAGDVVLAYLTEQRDAIVRLDPDARRDVPDAVHQMRVATRRARSTMQAFATVLEREATGTLTGELKWLAGVLGAARDLEVLRAAVSADADARPAELMLGPIRARIAAFFAPRQAAARREIATALDSERYLNLLAALDALLSEPLLLPAANKRAYPVLADTLVRQRRRVRRHLAAANGATGEHRDVELHEARKAAKRLRYVAEASEPVLGRRAADVVSVSKDFQDLLGEHQDAIVAVPVLRDLGVAAHLSGENGFSFGLLLGARLAAPVADPAAIAASWKTLSRKVDRIAG